MRRFDIETSEFVPDVVLQVVPSDCNLRTIQIGDVTVYLGPVAIPVTTSIPPTVAYHAYRFRCGLFEKLPRYAEFDEDNHLVTNLGSLIEAYG